MSDNQFSGWDDESEAVVIGNPKYDDDVAEMWQKKNDALIEGQRVRAEAARNTVAGPVAGNGVIQPQVGADLSRSFGERWHDFWTGVEKLGMLTTREVLDGGAHGRIYVWQEGGSVPFGTHRNIETAERWLQGELDIKARNDAKAKAIIEGGPKIITEIQTATTEAELKRSGVPALAARVDGLESKVSLALAQLTAIRELLEGQKSGN